MPPAQQLASSLFGESYKTINQYVDLLAGQGTAWGLIGPRELDRLWDRHILNSVALSELIPQGCQVVDVGSGAGLPGIPLAILRSDLDVVLLDSLLRRTTFLEQAVTELGLAERVRVVRSRAEDADLQVDVAVARAVAQIGRLAAWCAGLLRSEGFLLALKGDSAQLELDREAPVLAGLGLRGEVLQVRAHPAAEPTHVIKVSADR